MPLHSTRVVGPFRVRRMWIWFHLSVAVAFASVLAACGGGGDGSGTTPSYTIGGTLTGLAGGQEVTLNNDTDQLILSENGAFAFREGVSRGSNYSIVITGQPNGQTCDVDNGTGSSVSANVSNVTVTCTANTYTVGGVLTGLASGQELTLQNNGTDSTILKDNGLFTFSVPLTYGSSYNVTANIQTGQSMSCTVVNGSGTIFTSITDVNVFCATESVLHNFRSADSARGLYPTGSLVMDAQGNLYGATQNGGPGDRGTVYKLSPSSSGGYTESVLYDFSDPGTWAFPVGGLILDEEGNLYGTTIGGGTDGSGVVFKLSPSTGGGYTGSVLHNFSGSTADGGPPTGGLVMAGGNLYGTTSGGGGHLRGMVFELSPDSGGAYKILYSFLEDPDGRTPQSGLVVDSAGNVYGTTSGGGIDNGGTVFKLSPSTAGSYSESILHRFVGLDGIAPAAGLIVDNAGNLYGTTRLGTGRGGIGYGTVFKLAPSGGGGYTESVLYSFSGGDDGAAPLAGLTKDGAGNLYGTTASGGSANCDNGCGTVFILSPSTGIHIVLHRFTAGADGAAPAASMITDVAGNLFGTTSSGQGNGVSGGADTGNVFRILLH